MYYKSGHNESSNEFTTTLKFAATFTNQLQNTNQTSGATQKNTVFLRCLTTAASDINLFDCILNGKPVLVNTG